MGDLRNFDVDFGPVKETRVIKKPSESRTLLQHWAARHKEVLGYPFPSAHWPAALKGMDRALAAYGQDVKPMVDFLWDRHQGRYGPQKSLQTPHGLFAQKAQWLVTQLRDEWKQSTRVIASNEKLREDGLVMDASEFSRLFQEYRGSVE